MKTFLFLLCAQILFFGQKSHANGFSDENMREEDPTETIGDAPLIHSVLEEHGDGYRLVLHNIDLTFEKNGTSLPQQTQRQLEALARILSEESPNFQTMEISGHTDSLGGRRLNQKLSQKRALGVAKIFQKAGISSARLRTFGAASTDPIANNESDQGRRQNRRVDIVIKSSPVQIEALAKKLSAMDQTFAQLSMQR